MGATVAVIAGLSEPPFLRDKRYVPGMREYLANSGAGVREDETCAARVYTEAIDTYRKAVEQRGIVEQPARRRIGGERSQSCNDVRFSHDAYFRASFARASSRPFTNPLSRLS